MSTTGPRYMVRPSEAIVLAGGAGLRLRPMTYKVPKAMVKIASRPLLEWVLLWLKKNGVRRVVLGVAYKKSHIIRYFAKGDRLDLELVYSRHSVPGGTAEGFKKAIKYVEGPTFFAMNGDHITDLALADLQAPLGDCTIAIAHPRLPYGLIKAEGDLCTGFDEKPLLSDIYINTGIYHMAQTIIPHLPDTGNVETTTFPALAKLERLQVHRHEGLFVTVDSVKDLERAELAVKGLD